MERTLLLAWAAGFIDGEGHIGIVRRGNSHTVRLAATNTRRASIDRLVFLFGGGAYEYRGHFKWVKEGRSCVTVLEELLPFFTLKGSEAHVALELMSGIPTWGNRYSRPSEAEILRREGLRERLKALHRLRG